MKLILIILAMIIWACINYQMGYARGEIAGFLKGIRAKRDQELRRGG